MELVLKENTWAEVKDTLKEKLFESVKALMVFQRYPVPNESALVKGVKVRQYMDVNTMEPSCLRTSTRQGGVQHLIKADSERRKQHRVVLKRSRLTHVSHIFSDPATQLKIFLQAARDKASEIQ